MKIRIQSGVGFNEPSEITVTRNIPLSILAGILGVLADHESTGVTSEIIDEPVVVQSPSCKQGY